MNQWQQISSVKQKKTLKRKQTRETRSNNSSETELVAGHFQGFFFKCTTGFRFSSAELL